MFLGFGLQLGAQSYSPSLFSSFSPLDLGPLWFVDVSEQGAVFQDALGTTPAASGDPVGYIRDLSGNGNHILASSDAARGVMNISGGVSWVELDGVDDFFQAALTGLSADHTMIIGLRPISKSTGNDSSVSLGNGAGTYQIAAGTIQPDYACAVVSSNLGLTSFNSGTNIVTDVAQALRLNAGNASADLFMDASLVRSSPTAYNGGLGSALTLRVGSNRAPNAFLNMRFHAGAIFNRALTDAEIAQMAAWIAGKQGRTL